MLVLNRFRAASTAPDGAGLRADLERVLALLAARPGYVDGSIGRNVDEPDLWVLATTWESVGAYRRALSSYELKMHGVPVLSRALAEPGAYELVEADGVLNEHGSRVT